MKNIILLITDTFRYDNLGDRAGELSVRTPELDRFAAERATEIHGFYTGSFPTIPHRTDIATGRLGWPHYGWQAIDLSGRNHIASILAGCGYSTQLICDCPHLFKNRFDAAFAAATHNRGQEGDRPLLHLNDPIQQVMPPEKTRARPSMGNGVTLADMHRWTNRYYTLEQDAFSAKTGSMVCRWLEENYQGGPFFLWADFFDPHEPWDPPEYMVRRYDPDYDGTPMIHPNYGHSSVYTPAELHNLRSHYMAEAELVDRWVGRVLQKIDDLQLWDDTIVVVTSDHGFSIGEHERTGKSNVADDDDRYWPIYPEVGHVPFFIAAPGVAPGNSLDFLAQPMDYLPTMCELAGMTPNPPEPFMGKSFARLLLDGSGVFRDIAVSGSCIKAKPGAIPKGATTPFVVSAKWGYAPVGADGAPELYDMCADPMATNDLAKDHPEAVAEMHGRFLDYLTDHGASEVVLATWGKHPVLGADGTWAIDYPETPN